MTRGELAGVTARPPLPLSERFEEPRERISRAREQRVRQQRIACRNALARRPGPKKVSESRESSAASSPIDERDVVVRAPAVPVMGPKSPKENSLMARKRKKAARKAKTTKKKATKRKATKKKAAKRRKKA
jgi:hypothetical protein